MTCLSILTCTQYVDNELTTPEQAKAQQHLHNCSQCQQRVEHLTDERQALRLAMQSVTVPGEIPAFVPRPTVPQGLIWIGWLVLSAWAISLAWTNTFATATVPTWLDWLLPGSVGVGIDIGVNTLRGLLTLGNEWLSEAIRSTGQTLLLTLGAGVLWIFAKRHINPNPTFCVSVALLSVLVITAPATHAFELRHDELSVTITADEIIDDTLIVSAENIVIDGTITGDLIALGESVRIRGRVGGSLLAAAEHLSVEGAVAGNIVGIGEVLEYRGAPIGGNLYSAGESVTVHPDTTVQGNGLLAASKVEVHGDIGQDLVTATKHLSLLGTVARNLRFYGDRADLSSTASVAGNLTATASSEDALRIASAESVLGTTSINVWPEKPNKYRTTEFYFGILVKIFAALAAGLLLFFLVPSLRRLPLAQGLQNLVTVGWGAAALAVTPILAVITLITLIGAPIAISGLVVWLLALYFAGIIAAAYVARSMLGGSEDEWVKPILIGVPLFIALAQVPLLGGVLRLAALLLGLGLIAQWLREKWVQRAQ